MFSLRRRHFLIGLLVLLTLATNAFVAYWNIARLVRNGGFVAQTSQNADAIARVVLLSRDVETGSRGFVLSGDAAYLAPLRTAKPQLSQSLAQLKATTNDPRQKQSLVRLQSLVARHLVLAERAVAIKRTLGVDPARAFVRAGADRQQMEQIRKLGDEMKAREDELLSLRTGESSDSAQDAFRTFWIATGANLVFLALISWLLLQAARQNRMLERAVADLKRAELLRDSLAQMLVHDLRTPLTTLLGPLQMLGADLLGPLDPEQKELVHMSAHSGSRLLNMVNGLLDISKLEAGELKPARTSFELREAVAEARGEVGRDDDPTCAQVEIDVPAELQMHADRDLIVRVVINLLGNAQKHSPPGSRILVRARALETGVRVAVADRGEGIPAEDLGRIFDKFAQVEARSNGTKRSTGLGLTFCKLAVEAHGGVIGVESKVGVGSLFWFELPG